MRLRRWLRVFLCILVVLVLVTAKQYTVFVDASRRQLALEVEHEPIENLKAANRQISKQINAIQREKQFVLALSESEPTITLLGVLGQSVSDGEERVFLQKVELNNLGLASGAPTEKKTVIELAGVASNGASVKQFVERIRHLVPFGKVEVTSTRDYRLKHHQMQDFSVQCNF